MKKIAIFGATAVALAWVIAPSAQAATLTLSAGTTCGGATSATFTPGSGNVNLVTCVTLTAAENLCGYTSQLRPASAAEDGRFSVASRVTGTSVTTAGFTEALASPSGAITATDSKDYGAGNSGTAVVGNQTILLASFAIAPQATATNNSYVVSLGGLTDVTLGDATCSGASLSVATITLPSFTFNKAAVADTVAPDTSISGSCPTIGTATTASIAFTGTDNVAVTSYECSLDSATFATCTSAQSLSGLAVGPHTFRVRAKDAAGNVDATPASCAWSVAAPADTTPPDTSITAAPASGTATSVSIAFTGTDNVTAAASLTYECSLDGSAYAACTSPFTASGLSVGSHTFGVRAKDAAGNIDATPATASWTLTAAVVPVANVSVPTLSEWAQWLLMLLVVSAGLVSQRRRGN